MKQPPSMKVLACNMKMACSFEILDQVESFLKTLDGEDLDIIYAVPFPYLTQADKRLASQKNIRIFAQDVSQFTENAHTGEVSAEMLEDLSITGTIIGHSERRAQFNESNDVLETKILRAMKNNLQIIFCIGESEPQRNKNETLSVIRDQLSVIQPFLNETPIYIAYEPIWAIGTGKVPQNKQIEEVALEIRKFIEKEECNSKIPILYGGSVNEQNAEDLSKMESIDGFLVGGCCIKPEIVQVGKYLSKRK